MMVNCINSMAMELIGIVDFTSFILDQVGGISINCNQKDTIAKMVADIKALDIEFSYKDLYLIVAIEVDLLKVFKPCKDSPITVTINMGFIKDSSLDIPVIRVYINQNSMGTEIMDNHSLVTFNDKIDL